MAPGDEALLDKPAVAPERPAIHFVDGLPTA